MKACFLPGWRSAQAVWITLLLTVGPALAEEPSPFPPGNPHGFELKLPAGWTSVDSNLLAWIRDSRKQPVAGIPTAEGLYAYHRISATNEFDPPYIIVAVKGGGRTPDRFWRKLSQPGEPFRLIQSGLRQLSVDECRLLSASFDTNLFALRVEMEIQSVFGRLHTVGVSFLTENGFVEVGGWMWPSNHAAWAQTIEDVVSSVRLADWLQYRKREALNLYGGVKDWLYPVAFSAIIAVAGFFYIRHLRKSDSIDI